MGQASTTSINALKHFLVVVPQDIARKKPDSLFINILSF
jgi:hypothetical protein